MLNNGGIYGGDRRPSALQQAAASGAAHAGFASDPVPTAFVPDARWTFTTNNSCHNQHLRPDVFLCGAHALSARAVKKDCLAI